MQKHERERGACSVRGSRKRETRRSASVLAMQAPKFNKDLQPEWAGEEPCKEVWLLFFPKAQHSVGRSESVLGGSSWGTSGSLPNSPRLRCGAARPANAGNVRRLHDRTIAFIRGFIQFPQALELFCRLNLVDKAKYAQLENQTKMDDSTFTPNQFHGYSRIEGLKEQFMVGFFGTSLHSSKH